MTATTPDIQGATTHSHAFSLAARRRQRFRRAVFGDWHPLLRDPLDLLRLSFAVAAVAYLIAGEAEYAVRMAFSFLVAVAAMRLRLPRVFDLLFIVAWGLQAWGNAFSLFENIYWWDNLVHFVLPATSVPVLYVLGWRLGLVPSLNADQQHPRYRLGLVLFAEVTGLAIAALYEIYEYVMVNWLGADLAIGYADTIFDLALGAGGALAGGLLLLHWSAEKLPTERQPLATRMADVRKRRRQQPASRRIVTALQLAFLVWAAAELVWGHTSDAVALVAIFAVLQVPRLLRLPLIFDLAFVVAWSLQALGDAAGFWSEFPWWDTLVHWALPAVLAPTALILLIRIRVFPDVLARRGGRATVGTVLLVFLIATGFGSVYEIYEWFGDAYLGTTYQPNNSDTMTDATANAVGGLLGGAWLAAWAARSFALGRDRVSPR
jgi:hypothetical protein